MSRKNILVVYGYHIGEQYALDIGFRLEQDCPEGVIVGRYLNKPDRQNKISFKTPRLWGFIKNFSQVDYAIVLHNAGSHMEKVVEKYQMLYPGEKLPDIVVWYESGRKAPRGLEERMKQTMESSFRTALLFFKDELSYMPKGFDEISVEYYLYHLIPKDKALSFLKDLIEVLRSH